MSWPVFLVREPSFMQEELQLDMDPTAYQTFVEDLANIDAILESHYVLEAVLNNNPRAGVINAAKNALHTGTKRTTDTLGTVGKAVGVGGKVYGTAWDVMWKLFDLAVSAVAFMVDNIGNLLKAVINGAKFVLRIPKTTLNKIRGNLELYIPAQAIDDFYGKQVSQKIHTFLQTMELFSQGETWGKFKRIMEVRDTEGNVVAEEVGPKGKDIDLAKRMKRLYIDLSYMDFKLDTIDMSNETNRQIYLSSEKSIRFVDTNGKQHHLNYYEALQFLLEDMRSCQKELTKMQEKVGDKHRRAQAAGQWATLSRGHQNLISEVIQMFSQMAQVLGKMTKSIIHDVKQLNGALKKIGQLAADEIKDPNQAQSTNQQGIQTDLSDGTMAAAAYRQRPTRTMPADFSFQTWKNVPAEEKKAFSHLNDLWIQMVQELVADGEQRGRKVELVTIYLMTTSDENVKLGVFGFPGKFSLGNKGNGPIVFNVKDVSKDELPPSVVNELKPNEKIYIDC